MSLKHLAAAALCAVSVSAFATPQYWGETSATGVNVGSMGAGYYIWNDADNTDNWHIRWTGIGLDYDPVHWAGQITFHNSELDSTSTFKFEGSGIHQDSMNVDYGFFDDEIEFLAKTNNTGGIDGIDFTLSGEYELMDFNLWADFFAESTAYADSQATASDYIFISGQYHNPKVITTDGFNQTFEISTVPEPASLALLGLGLLGLSAARRGVRKG